MKNKSAKLGGNCQTDDWAEAKVVEEQHHAKYGLPQLEQPETTQVMLNQSGGMEINQANKAGKPSPELKEAIEICSLASGQQTTVRRDHEVKENICIWKPNEIL